MKIHTLILSFLACIFTLFLSAGTLEASTGKITGTVVDKVTHKPIAGATIELIRCNRVIATTTTATNGTYTFSNVSNGDYTVKASASGYQHKFLGADVDKGRTVKVNFCLIPIVGTLKGKVTDAITTNAIAGATVTVIRGALIIDSTTTDGSGNYTITGLEEGSYTVVADAVGYQPKSTGAKIRENQTTTANFKLQPNPGSISGTVTDAVTTTPIQFADVSLFDGPTLIATTLTDASGNYSFPHVATGSYSVRCFALNYQISTKGAKVTPPANTVVDFALEPNPGEISGIVRDSVTNKPIEGATVSAIHGSLIIGFAITGPDGAYTIPSLFPGSYKVFASATGYETGSVGAIVNAGQTTIINFNLSPQAGSISGTVTDGASTPIEAATIRVFQGDSLIATTLTDASGQYDVPGLTPGNYRVEASAAGFESKSVGATVTAGNTTIVNFALGSLPGSIAGMITDAVTTLPIAGATVDVYEDQMLIATAFTDPNGNYEIDGISPGSYAVVISASEYQSAIVGATVTASMTTTVNAALLRDAGDVTGLVTDAKTQKPIAGAAIHMYVGAVVVDVAITDPNGFYHCFNESPGEYFLVAYAIDFQARGSGAHINPNMTTVVNFALQPNPGSVFGTVIDQTTTDPIPGATVELYDGSLFVTSTLTDSNGNYSIGNLTPGSYTLVFGATGYQDNFAGVIITANNSVEVDIGLQPNPSSVSGTVKDFNTSAPIEGAIVTIYMGTTVIDTVVTDISGAYTFPNLPQGFFTIVASATDYQDDAFGVDIPSPGSTITGVDFLLKINPGTITGTVTDAVSNQPIHGAIIDVYDGPTLIDSIFTDAQGQYSFTSLAPGFYTVVASANNYQTASSGANVTAGGTTVVDFALQLNPGTLKGTVTSATFGNPVYAATVDVYLNHVLVASVLTDPNGNYLVTGLAPGNYTVIASAPDQGYTPFIANATIMPKVTTTLNFTLNQNHGALQGTVTDSCTTFALPGATISVYLGSDLVTSAITDINGDYFISDLAPGNYSVVAEASGYVTQFSPATIVSMMPTTLDFALDCNPAHQGSISGTVTDAGNGAPITGATISIFSGSMFVTYAITDSNGNYIVTDLPPGAYTVQAMASNYVTASASATVVAGQNTPVNFVLTPIPLNPSSIAGEAIDNKFMTQTDRVHKITWTASPSPFVVHYLVYRDGVLVKTVQANGKLCYEDHNNNNKTTIIYTVVTVNAFGERSSGVSVRLR